MVKRVLVYFFILLFGIQFISAVQFDMKSNYSQGETLIAKVSGNFYTAIKNENVFLYRKDAQIRVPMEFYVGKIGNEYYVYGQLLGKSPDNYSLIIKDVKYATAMGKTSTDDIVQNFSVDESVADFSIRPGFIEKTKGNFSIYVKNLREVDLVVSSVSEITVEGKEVEKSGLFSDLFGQHKEDNNKSTTYSVENSLSLLPGEEKEMKFTLISFEEKLKTVALKSANTIYEIPVYFLATEIPVIEEVRYFEFEDGVIRFYIPFNETKTEIVLLKNKGQNLTNIIIGVSSSVQKIVSVLPQEIEAMQENESSEVKITIKMDNESVDSFIKNISEENRTYSGKIEAIASENYSADISLEIVFTKGNFAFVEKPKPKTCLELGGKICDKTKEQCSGNVTYAEDVCCLGICQEQKKSSVGKWVGWIIVIFVVLFLIWFFLKKYRGSKGEINLMNVAKGKK